MRRVALAGVVAGCATTPAPEPAAGPVPQLASATTASCNGLLQSIAQQLVAGVPSVEIEPVPLALEGGPPVDPGGLRPAASTRCRLHLEFGPIDVVERTSPPRRVQSAFVADVEMRAHPRYAAARDEIASAGRMQRSRGLDVARTGDPTFDLIGTTADGVWALVESAAGTQRESAARRALAATPKTTGVPVWEDYSYEETLVAVEKRAPLTLTLQPGGRTVRLEAGARRTFRFAPEQHAADRGRPDGRDLDTRDDLESWRVTPPVPALPELIRAFAERPA
jgi:hypothetical protein